MILYFTGTGNSRYLATVWETALDEILVDVAQAIRSGNHPQDTPEKPYAFISPVYARGNTHCMACICQYPTEAIENGKRTKERCRYVCTERI